MSNKFQRWTSDDDRVLESRYYLAVIAGPRSPERESLCSDLGRDWGSLRARHYALNRSHKHEWTRAEKVKLASGFGNTARDCNHDPMDCLRELVMIMNGAATAGEVRRDADVPNVH